MCFTSVLLSPPPFVYKMSFPLYPSSKSVPFSLWALSLTEVLQVFIMKLNLTLLVLSILVCFCLYYRCGKLPWLSNNSWVCSSCVSGSCCRFPVLLPSPRHFQNLYLSQEHFTFIPSVGAAQMGIKSEAAKWHAAVSEKPTVAVEAPCCFPPLPFCI